MSDEPQWAITTHPHHHSYDIVVKRGLDADMRIARIWLADAGTTAPQLILTIEEDEDRICTPHYGNHLFTPHYGKSVASALWRATRYVLTPTSIEAIQQLVAQGHTPVTQPGICDVCGSNLAELPQRNHGGTGIVEQEQAARRKPAPAEGLWVFHPWAITVRPTGHGFDILASFNQRVAHMYLDDQAPGEPDLIILVIEHPDRDGTHTMQVDSADDLARTLEQETVYRLTPTSLDDIRDLSERHQTTQYLARL